MGPITNQKTTKRCHSLRIQLRVLETSFIRSTPENVDEIGSLKSPNVIRNGLNMNNFFLESEIGDLLLMVQKSG